MNVSAFFRGLDWRDKIMYAVLGLISENWQKEMKGKINKGRSDNA